MRWVRNGQWSAPCALLVCHTEGSIFLQGKKIYHVPRQRDYERTSIDLSRGERMFCSSEEAVRTGWQPARR